MSADRQIASFIAAVERNDLKAARWIYAGLDPQAQRQADLILVGQIAHHEDQAGLALERGEFMGRLATLMEIHGAETVADLPAHVLDQVNADLIALGLAEEEL